MSIKSEDARPDVGPPADEVGPALLADAAREKRRIGQIDEMLDRMAKERRELCAMRAEAVIAYNQLYDRALAALMPPRSYFPTHRS